MFQFGVNLIGNIGLPKFYESFYPFVQTHPKEGFPRKRGKPIETDFTFSGVAVKITIGSVPAGFSSIGVPSGIGMTVGQK
jgi:hypothetical protein